jgi:molybdopterin-guanine dinucleotide biosynthesis protein A
MTVPVLPPFTAAILAGGQARRLGGADKCTLTVGGRTILDRQLALLRGLTPHVLLVGTHRQAPAHNVSVVPDGIPAAGALGGVYSALLAAPADPVLVVACDMPFVTEALVRRLVTTAGGEADVVVPRDARGRHPLCATWARRVAPHLRRRIEAGRLSVRDALDDLRVHEIGAGELAALDPDGQLLLNVNTPDDYARARDAAAGASPHR